MFNIIYLSEIILYFAIYSLIGWALEVLYASYESKKFVNRGFLFGPVCPIYGIGVLFLITILGPIANHPFLFFIGAIITTSALEYLTGFILESIFKTNWWDYSDQKYNLDGKICLKFSIYWGFLSLFLFYFIHPSIVSFVSLIILKTSFYLSLAIFMYFLIDFIISLIFIINLRSIFHKLDHLKDQYEDDFLKFKRRSRRLFKAFPHIKLVK
ncbi:MAG: putative ABC transporter permease [Candidatus Shapirobacteria bacterium]|jgi:uncharacterized membrane protein|nr:putative ABC transporter permease [Candidatus Shapirobacteria bacterium]